MEIMDIQVFSNEMLGDVRVIKRDGEPWFVANDVCKCLDIVNSRNAVAKLDDDEKGASLTDTLGGKQTMTIISESGLYSLVLGSRKPEARQFKRWIMHEVIPQIRKTGGYLGNTDNMDEKEILARALLITQRTIEEKQKTIEEQKEKIINLSDMNFALAADKRLWKDSSVINAMIRRYSGGVKWGKFAYGWEDFYKELLYKCGINLKTRKTNWDNANPTKKKVAIYKFLSKEEIPEAVSVAAAMCEANGVNVSDILRKYMIKKEAE